MNINPEIIQAESSYDTAKKTLVNSKDRGLPVFNGEDFTGIVTRRCFIEKPQRKLVMVDHNEVSQSVPGAEQADILEIIDHHRISPLPTRTPIYMNIRPVGSTCTIVYRHYLYASVEISRETAILLLSGILSDTVILKSPTTTTEDIEAAEHLSEICGKTVKEFGKEMLENSAVLDKTPPGELISADFKEYREEDLSFGVGQAEVINLEGASRLKEDFITELYRAGKKRGLDWSMILITDIIREHSVLITTPMVEAENLLIYQKLEDNLYDLPGILSRKKQLLPELLRVAEELKKKR
jgi:manganese-dependent inorganic pyrophosphatase